MIFVPTIHPHYAWVGYFLLIKFFLTIKKIYILLWINFIGVCQSTESKQSRFRWLTELDNSNFGVWRENRKLEFFSFYPLLSLCCSCNFGKQNCLIALSFFLKGLKFQIESTRAVFHLSSKLRNRNHALCSPILVNTLMKFSSPLFYFVQTGYITVA